MTDLLRHIVETLALVLVAFALNEKAAVAGDGRPPNVLILCADDHAAYVTGCYGNALARTPNIDRLAAAGIRFDRAYCNAPVCTASRQSFLCGRYPRSIGVTELQTPLPESEITLADSLKQAGFDTAAIGKMHFNSDLAHGFDLRLDAPQYRRWLNAQPRMPTPEGVLVQPPWRPFKDPARIWLNAEARPIDTPEAQMDGRWYAERAAEYLLAERAKPFLLMVSFYQPHSPFQFPLEYREKFAPASFAVPSVGAEDENQIPAQFRDLTDAEKRGINAAYYTATEFMDACVGVVLDALDRSGQADNTIVVYLGDHGYMLGQHGRFEKHCSYEEAVRVPLVMRYPQRMGAGRTSAAFVELVDLVATLHDLCEQPTTAHLQGKSLAPLLDGKTARHREHVIVEYAQNDEIMLRDQRWKLVYERNARRRTDGYDTERPITPNLVRLFDLHNDPAEMHNVAAEPENAPRVKQMLRVLADHLIETARTPEGVPGNADPLTVLDYCVQPRDVRPEG